MQGNEKWKVKSEKAEWRKGRMAEGQNGRKEKGWRGSKGLRGERGKLGKVIIAAGFRQGIKNTGISALAKSEVAKAKSSEMLYPGLKAGAIMNLM